MWSWPNLDHIGQYKPIYFRRWSNIKTIDFRAVSCLLEICPSGFGHRPHPSGHYSGGKKPTSHYVKVLLHILYGDSSSQVLYIFKVWSTNERPGRINPSGRLIREHTIKIVRPRYVRCFNPQRKQHYILVSGPIGHPAQQAASWEVWTLAALTDEGAAIAPPPI